MQYKIDSQKDAPTKSAENQPPPEDMEVDQERPNNFEKNQAEGVDQEQPLTTEGDQGEKKDVLSTSSYESLDSTNKEA